MKATHKFRKLFALSIVVLLMLACSGGGLASATETVTLSPTPLATNTAMARPTSTSQPTRTEVPPTPTAVPVGMPVSNDSYEVTVVKVRKLESVYLSDTQHWAANPGYQFVELGIKVKNLKPDGAASVRWNEIYIIEKEGSYYPGWGSFKAVDDGIEINTSGLSFYEIDNPGKEVVFKNDVYLRLIFTVKLYDKTTILFGFDDSPLTEIPVQ